MEKRVGCQVRQPILHINKFILHTFKTDVLTAVNLAFLAMLLYISFDYIQHIIQLFYILIRHSV